MKTVAILEVIEGPEGIRGRRVDHKGIPLVIGRAPQADLTLPDSRVSKSHAIIEQRGQAYYLVDLESLNGTLLNGERIVRAEGAKLQHGDDIAIAGHRLKFYIFTGLEEGEYRTIQKRITLNAIQKYSRSSAVLYMEIPRFKELYTKYEVPEVDHLRDNFMEIFRTLVHEGAPYYAQPIGERGFAFFDAPSHAIDFARELVRRIERLNLTLLRNPTGAIKKFDARMGIDAGALSITLGDEGRIEQVSGAVMSRARQIATFASPSELWVSETVFSAVPEKLRPTWIAVETPPEMKLGALYKHQTDTTAQF